ncbi:transcription antitermination factor NusB [Campylobacter sp. RM9344]|uniref:Transcription antitermination protein NusB n=1 Tax=Campylobacter californiensis TaxID=1032243 RepID=A0AAW3ZTX4_9BACT|nr:MULTISPECIES: transcription antitermination factor NusB [unclassified Campylobacter]MBE2985419.1 transcription antitermination factor NusB [Campylobacter sp. RM6883]MBE2986855.1 transcription antitermination factor NusB [Campylobacter sp. RM12919]MBE2988586.1 transcription antitermination factor NusB [Campylobacter sp. RM12920]MBE2995650.1 transcription antitermination factor NusB [Campylobacter sp. RM6913]MBE3029715.1 transcription antitermination factor NusB [Campylobacter sp. RM9344]
MATRHQARQAVVSLLYAYEMGNTDDAFIDEFLEEKKIRNERKESVVKSFREILATKDKLDEQILQYLKDGDLDKVGIVERNILRLGFYEINEAQTDIAVVINEAVELAKELTSDTSPRFINGVLGALKAKK